jgi:hypothetical protein
MTREQLLEAALRPFAEAAKSRVVRDALSFGPPADVELIVTRGFSEIRIPASAFATARKALTP